MCEVTSEITNIPDEGVHFIRALFASLWTRLVRDQKNSYGAVIILKIRVFTFTYHTIGSERIKHRVWTS